MIYVGRELLGAHSRFALDTYAHGAKRHYCLYDAEVAGEKSGLVYEGSDRAVAVALVMAHDTAVHRFEEANPHWPMGARDDDTTRR